MAVYRFGEFEFDSTTGELRQTGHHARLRPQPAKALEHLVQRHGALVSRRELQAAIWRDGTFVHFDHGLNSCMKQIRSALGDSRSRPRFVETLVRRGFRFLAPVVVVADDPAAAVPFGAEFPVDFLLTAAVRTAGDRLRISSTLIDARTQRRVWMGRFDAALDRPVDGAATDGERVVRDVIAALGCDARAS